MVIYTPNHLCTYAHHTELSEFVLPKQSLILKPRQAQQLFHDDIVHEFAEIMQNKGHYQIR